MPEHVTDEMHEEAKRLLEAATPGPWEKVGSVVWGPNLAGVDGELIAHARTALPAYVAQREADRAEIERLQSEAALNDQELNLMSTNIQDCYETIESLSADIERQRTQNEQLILDSCSTPLPCGHPAACVRPEGGDEGTTRYCGWCDDIELLAHERVRHANTRQALEREKREVDAWRRNERCNCIDGHDSHCKVVEG